MPLRGDELWDAEGVFDQYAAMRDRPVTPFSVMESPDFLDLVGPVTGLRVLDLGCGDGRYGRELLDAGAASWVGVDASAKMVEAALERVGARGAVRHATFESWEPEERAYDVIVSRLALHWADEIAPVFAKAFGALVPGGRLVFSVDHPILTAAPDQLADGAKIDRYFVPGPREISWMGQRIAEKHRTLAEWFGAVRAAGFVVDDLREGEPRRELVDEARYAKAVRFPHFLVMAARRPG